MISPIKIVTELCAQKSEHEIPLGVSTVVEGFLLWPALQKNPPVLALAGDKCTVFLTLEIHKLGHEGFCRSNHFIRQHRTSKNF